MRPDPLNFSDNLFNATAAGSTYWHNETLIITLLVVIAMCEFTRVMIIFGGWMLNMFNRGDD
jgi:hypothetical protein